MNIMIVLCDIPKKTFCNKKYKKWKCIRWVPTGNVSSEKNMLTLYSVESSQKLHCALLLINCSNCVTA